MARISFLFVAAIFSIPKASTFSLKPINTRAITTRTRLHSRPFSPVSSVFFSVRKRPLEPTSTRLLSSRDETPTSEFALAPSSKILKYAYGVICISCSAAWIATSKVALSFHPDPIINAQSLGRHNLLTILQALVLPLPLIFGSAWSLASEARCEAAKIVRRQLHWGVAAACAYTAAAVGWAPAFSCGYHLFDLNFRKVVAATFGIAALAACGGGVQSEGHAINCHGPAATGGLHSSLYSIGRAGLTFFTAMPLFVSFPRAAIPAILGKRLSRSFVGFTALAAVMSHCLKRGADRKQLNEVPIYQKMRLTLGIGSALHFILVMGKALGVDGGGLLLPGDGLWINYPAMTAVPYTALVSMLVFGVVTVASFVPVTEQESLQ